MTLLADISTGNTDTADVLFLLGGIFAVLAAVLHVVPTRTTTDGRAVTTARYAPVLLAAAVALVAFGLLAL